jgi:hypothetical protein
LNPLTNPWVEKLTQTHTLIEQKPTGFRVAGTHCHLYPPLDPRPTAAAHAQRSLKARHDASAVLEGDSACEQRDLIDLALELLDGARTTTPPPDDGAEAATTEAMAVASVAESGKERFGLRSLLREGAVEPWSTARSRRELGLGFGERRRSWERPRDLEWEVRFLERGWRRATAAEAEAASSMACGEGRLEGIGDVGARARQTGDSNFGVYREIREQMGSRGGREGESSGQRRRLQHSGADMGTISSWVFATRRHADALVPRSTLVQPPPPMPRGEGTPAAVMPRSALPTRAEAVTSATETPVHQIAIRRVLSYAKCLRWVFVGPFAGSSSGWLPATNTTRCALQPSSVH